MTPGRSVEARVSLPCVGVTRKRVCRPRIPLAAALRKRTSEGFSESQQSGGLPPPAVGGSHHVWGGTAESEDHPFRRALRRHPPLSRSTRVRRSPPTAGPSSAGNRSGDGRLAYRQFAEDQANSPKVTRRVRGYTRVKPVRVAAGWSRVQSYRDTILEPDQGLSARGLYQDLTLEPDYDGATRAYALRPRQLGCRHAFPFPTVPQTARRPQGRLRRRLARVTRGHFDPPVTERLIRHLQSNRQESPRRCQVPAARTESCWERRRDKVQVLGLDQSDTPEKSYGFGRVE